MGRRKISIAPIKDDRNRQVTFLKRKNGLFKKAYELGVLCSADVAVIVFNASGKLFEFHSGDMDAILLKYSHYAGPPHEKRGPEDYVNKDLDAATKRGLGGKMTNMTDDEDEDDDDEKPLVATGSSGVRMLPQASRGKQAIRAAAERKAEEAERSRGPSEEVGGPEGSGSRSGSSAGQGAGPSHDSLPNLNGLPRPPPSAQQPPQLPPLPSLTFASNAASLPSLTSQQPGLPQSYANATPFGVSASPIALPSWAAAAAAGLSVPPVGFSLPAGVTGWPAPSFPSGQPSSANAAGGVPAWFAGGSGMQMSGAQALGGQLVQAPLHLLQQFGGVAGWPPGAAGMFDPNAALQAFQQQQHQSGYHDGARPQSGPATQPTPAPMYGTPASMPPPPATQHNTPPVYAEQSHHETPRPSSVASMASQSQSQNTTSPATHSTPHLGHAQPGPPTRSNSLNAGSKPRLSVAIPAETVMEGTKPGLVTAGGASILGAGLAARGGQGQAQAQPAQEGGENNGMPRSAFAADLLPSPFYPNPILPGFGTTFLLPSAGPTTTQVFQWPSAVSAAPAPPAAADQQNYRPAPMLGEEEAPDLLRRRSSEQSTNGLADLTQAAAALEGDAGARGVKRGAREEEHDGGGSGGGDEGEEGDKAGAKKHRAA
ncbi:hypothetical protein JCM10296v2_003473 [Rhodotorula toruloides]